MAAHCMKINTFITLVSILIISITSCAQAQKTYQVYDYFQCTIPTGWSIIQEESIKGYFVRQVTHDTVYYQGFKGDFSRQMCFPSDYCGNYDKPYKPLTIVVITHPGDSLDDNQKLSLQQEIDSVDQWNKKNQERYQ